MKTYCQDLNFQEGIQEACSFPVAVNLCSCNRGHIQLRLFRTVPSKCFAGELSFFPVQGGFSQNILCYLCKSVNFFVFLCLILFFISPTKCHMPQSFRIIPHLMDRILHLMGVTKQVSRQKILTYPRDCKKTLPSQTG